MQRGEPKFPDLVLCFHLALMISYGKCVGEAFDKTEGNLKVPIAL